MNVLSALVYLQVHSLKNSIVRRIRRLKQPKYLAGGIVGVLYFYFYFGRYVFGFRGGHTALPVAGSVEDRALFESLGALLMLVPLVLAWVLPHERAALTFTEAEIAFLFPAPITRRGLIQFKLLRSQLRILFTSVLLMLISHRLGSKLWIQALGWWVILSTINLHWLGSSFARTMLLDRGVSNWQRRLGVLGLVLALAAAAVWWAHRTLPGVDFASLNGVEDVKDYARRILAAGPIPYLLYPCRLVVRPYLAPDGIAFLLALGPALLVVLLLYVWVLRSDVAFEEASVEASQRTAAKVAAIRAGNWRAAHKKVKGQRPPFVLHPTGPPTVALLWKNLIGAGQMFTVRLLIILAVGGVCVAVSVGQTSGQSGMASVVAMMASMLLAWSLLIGPQLLRQDFRQDLLLADVLKTYPLPSWQIALGELLAPVLILTAIQWVLLLVTAGLLCQSHGPGPKGGLVVGIALGSAMLAPMLNLILLQIPNAAVLLFPAWFQAGKAGGGIEATGQRIIFMLGQLLALAVALLPAAAIFTGVFFLLKLFVNAPLAIPLAAAGATLVLGLEAAFGVALLGRLFERFDVSAEMTP